MQVLGDPLCGAIVMVYIIIMQELPEPHQDFVPQFPKFARCDDTATPDTNQECSLKPPKLMVCNFGTVSQDPSQAHSVETSSNISISQIPNAIGTSPSPSLPHFFPSNCFEMQYNCAETVSPDSPRNYHLRSTSIDSSNLETCTKIPALPDPSARHEHLIENPLPDHSQSHMVSQGGKFNKSEDFLAIVGVSSVCHSKSTLVDADMKIVPSDSIQTCRFVSITPDQSKFCVYYATSVSTHPSFPMDSIEYMSHLASKSPTQSVDVENESQTPSLTWNNSQPSYYSLHADDSFRLPSLPHKLPLTYQVGSISQKTNCVDDRLVDSCHMNLVRTMLPNPTQCHVDVLKTSSVVTDHTSCVTSIIPASLEDYLDITLLEDDCSVYAEHCSSEQSSLISPPSVTFQLDSTTPCHNSLPELSNRLERYNFTNSSGAEIGSLNPTLPNIAGIRYYGKYVNPNKFPSPHDQKYYSNTNPCTAMPVGVKVAAFKYPIAGFGNTNFGTECSCQHSIENVITFPEVSQAVSQPDVSTKVSCLDFN